MKPVCCDTLQCVAVCCSAVQCVAVYCSAVQCVAVCCSAVQCVAVCCSAVQCVAVCCSAVQCVAVCCSAVQCVAAIYTRQMQIYMKADADIYKIHMWWLQLVGSIKLQVSFAEHRLFCRVLLQIFAKETYDLIDPTDQSHSRARVVV